MLAWMLVWFVAFIGHVTSLLQNLEQVPKYYVDPAIQAILVDERLKCMVSFSKKGTASALTELKMVRDMSATEFYRSHELFAHHFFVESAENPHRVQLYEEAEFEYIPLLPLYWASKQKEIGIESCNYHSLITSILKAQAYLVARDAKHTTGATIPKFAVASTFNLRTVLGTGMPTQIRRGEAWESVSNFVMSLSIGHYERWPQCPDLLRKSFKYVVELPYVMPYIDKKGRGRSKSTVKVHTQESPGRKSIFLFSGNFELFGPEMVCSVRNEIINLASTRNDTTVVNSTAHDANTLLQVEKLTFLASKSVFCLITKSDSYSTSFFYLALSAGCIPVVISDWFVFAFPWLIPYEKFVLRIQENDFLQNPNYVLDYIATTIGKNEKLLNSMRSIMKSYAHLLSFDPVAYTADRFQFDKLPQGDVYLQGKVKVPSIVSKSNTANNANSISKGKAFNTYLPLELLLLELRYAQRPHQYYNNVPCLRPMVCARDHLGNVSYTDTPTDYVFPAKTKVWTIERTYTDPTTKSSGGNAVGRTESAGYSVINDGYQVKAVFFPNLIDIRSHLCRHAMRLIGSYKIVYIMQCVRILWPLHPGTFKPVDNVIRYSPDYNNITHKLTVARYKGGKYSVEPDGISKRDMQFVIDFHNATKPAGYRLVNYPVTSDRRNILPFNELK